MARVPLSASGFYRTPKIHWDKATMTGRPFLYFAYGAAVAEVAVDSWLSWFDDFVVKGNCGADKEKSGTLTLLSPNQQKLASIGLFNLGIFRLGSIDSEAAQDRLKLARAELYCERMEFKLGA